MNIEQQKAELFFVHAGPRQDAGELNRCRRGDHHHSVDAAIPARLEQQRDIQDDDSGALSHRSFQRFGAMLRDQRMDDRLKGCER